MKTPINAGLLQSDLDVAGFNLLNYTPGGGGTVHGIPAGGSMGQSLTKIDGTDYNAHWSTVTGGGSGGPNALITANVKDAPYSAVGDGVADDSAAINAAIAAVVTAGGGTVFFPKGIYLCNGAFDGSFNCILKIPNPATPVTVELVGEEHPPWGVFTTFDLSHASTIRTTKTGTGTGPALLAGSQARGTGRVADYTTMSNTLVKIRNLNFILPDNPSLHGVRLDGVGQAFVENCNVMVEAQNAGTAFTQPTHGTTGLWMPNAINFSMNWVKHVTVTGFDTGFMTGEHLRAPMMQVFNCLNGVSFLEAMYPSWANIQLGNCVEGIRFVGQHTVDLLVETEHAPGGWQSCAHDIKDASNYGSGRIQCYVGSGFPPASTYPAIDGGTGLEIIDMFSRISALPASGSYNGKVVASTLTVGAAAASGKILQGNGTNFVASTPTWPTAAGTAGYTLRSDGTNIASYPQDMLNSSIAAIGPGFAADTYLTGSNVTVAAGDFKIKGQYHCLFDMFKTAAGIAAPVVTVRVGTTGTITDTATLVFTFGAGTGVSDTGIFEVWVTWKSIGSGTSAVIIGTCKGVHNLATTGLFNNAAAWTFGAVASSGFNSTTATTIGVSFNGGSSFSGTNGTVQATLNQ